MMNDITDMVATRREASPIEADSSWTKHLKGSKHSHCKECRI